jgi:type II secretory pathway pseudopilin PulG
LIEMLVAMLLLSAVLTMGMTLLNTLFRLEAVARERAEARAATARLARAFRRDVRQAVGILKSPAEGEAIGLDLGAGRTVTYRIRSGIAERVEQVGGGAERVERYRVPARGLTVRVDGRTMRMRLDRRMAATRTRAGDPLEITAIRGADRRFATREEEL